MRNWTINSERKWVNKSDKQGIETDSGWYSGKSEQRNWIPETDRLHFDFKKSCKVTEHQEQYILHRQKFANWLERDGCRITKNGSKWQSFQREAINHLTADNCKITRNNAAGDGYFQRSTDEHLTVRETTPENKN